MEPNDLQQSWQEQGETCSGYLDHPFLKNETQEENNQAF